MSSSPRHLIRTAALGLGSLVLAAAAAGCSTDGGGASSTGTASESESAASDGSAASDSGSGDPSADPSDRTEDAEGGDPDLAAAEQQVISYFRALGDQDAEAACGLLLDESTGEPLAGDALSSCASYLEESGSMDAFTPEIVEQITPEALTSVHQDDGTIAVSVEGSTALALAQAADGEWYIDADDS